MKIINLFQKRSKSMSSIPKTHTVVCGDTLWNLSQTYNVVFEDLLNANPSITNPNMIYVGQVINIPDKHLPDKHLPEQNQNTYTVKSGDNLWLLSNKLGVVYEKLLEVNPQITNPNFIYVGQVINLPSGN